MSSPCSDDPKACITPAVRQWVLGSYLMGKQQASAVALYQLLAPEGSEHGYGNWSSWPEWAAEVGTPSGLPEESAAGLWTRHYSTGFVVVNPWPERTLAAPLPPAPAGKEWRDLYGRQPGASLQMKPVTAATLVLRGKRPSNSLGRGKTDDVVWQVSRRRPSLFSTPLSRARRPRCLSR